MPNATEVTAPVWLTRGSYLGTAITDFMFLINDSATSVDRRADYSRRPDIPLCHKNTIASLLFCYTSQGYHVGWPVKRCSIEVPLSGSPHNLTV